MLTLTAPIELKTRTGFIRDHSEFYERMTANYSLMGNNVEAGELLHLFTTPPEIYLAGGGMTTISGSTVVNNKNEEKLTIINNVINRILLSTSTQLTYQDRAYITDVLNSIGIKDDKRFMSQVKNIFEETEQTNRLINAYFENDTDIPESILKESVRSILKTRSENRETEVVREEGKPLYNIIMDRLKTGAVYQIVSNFNKSILDNRIDGREYSISEQSYTAQQIFLSRIRENTLKEILPLIFTTEEEAYEEEEQQGDVYNLTDNSSQETHIDSRTYPEKTLTEMAREFVRQEREELKRKNDDTYITNENAGVTERMESRELERERVVNSRLKERLENRIKSTSEGLERILTYLTVQEGEEVQAQGQTQIYNEEGNTVDRGTYITGGDNITVDGRHTDVRTENISLRQGDVNYPERRILAEEIRREIINEAGIDTEILRESKGQEEITAPEGRAVQDQTLIYHNEGDIYNSGLNVSGDVNEAGDEVYNRTEIDSRSYRQGDVSNPERHFTREETRRESVNRTDELIYRNDNTYENEIINAGPVQSLRGTDERGSTYREGDSYNINASYPERRIIDEEVRKEVINLAGELVYHSENTYEREVFNGSEQKSPAEINISSAVFLDVIRNLIHTGYEKIISNNAVWQDYESFFAGSSQNTLNRLNQTSSDIYYRTVVQEGTEASERVLRQEETIEEEPVNAQESGNTEEALIAELLRINNYNINNVERYRQMRSIIERVREGRKRRDAAQRTMQASKASLDDSEALEEILEEEEKISEEERDTAFKEIKLLFPDESARVFEIIEQYLENPEIYRSDNTVVTNNLTGLVQDIETVNRNIRQQESLILREKEEVASEADREVERITARAEAGTAPLRQEQKEREPEQAQMVLRQQESISAEELEETIERLQRNTNRVEVTGNDIITNEERKSNVTQVINESGSVITERDREDIERLISRGVHEQMGVISDQVMHRLERRLRDEKSRRGI